MVMKSKFHLDVKSVAAVVRRLSQIRNAECRMRNFDQSLCYLRHPKSIYYYTCFGLEINFLAELH